ncbi:transcriptional regulator [Marivivens aquimaris]|uniref:transcriptional regulator n=1 Tax=Marivivens aquimaris TaxID=2774876 RepID=UPI001881B455|nr:transcriptional regulator [Marivivens aquimaris]
MSKPREKALAAYGGALPDWIEVLVAESERTSQSKAAAAIGVSPAVVTGILGNNYKGIVANVEARVRGSLMRDVVQCPALGEISTRKCIDWRDRAKGPIKGNNMLRVMMFRSCRKCPRFKPQEENE